MAVITMFAIALTQRNVESTNLANGAPDRSRLASSILFHLLLLGGLSADEAMRDVRRRAGLASPVTGGIDIMN